MERATLICLIACILSPSAFAQDKPIAAAPCKAYFTVLETDEVTVGLPMLGLNKPQLSWYKKHGNSGNFAGICYWDLTGRESQLSLAEFLSKEKSGAIQEPDAPFYVITWGESLVTKTYVGSRRTETVTEDNSNNTSRTITVPVTETYAGTKRYYVAEGILQRWDGKTQGLIPVSPIHNRNRTVFTSASTSLLKSGLEAIKKAGEIEATESARTFEYAIQLAARTAKYFADMSTLQDKLAARASASDADSFRKGAEFWRAHADGLAKTNFKMANATVEQVEMYRDATLTRGCGAIEDMGGLMRTLDGARPNLAPEVVQAVDAVEADQAALKADCSSEHAISLVKKTGKPPGN